MSESSWSAQAYCVTDNFTTMYSSPDICVDGFFSPYL